MKWNRGSGGEHGGLRCSRGLERAKMCNNKRGGQTEGRDGGLYGGRRGCCEGQEPPSYRGVICRWRHCMASLTTHIGYNALVSLQSVTLTVRLMLDQI